MSIRAVINHPDHWLDDFPRPDPDGHKYRRGHAVIYGAPELTGATRLAAEACSRIGAGLVTVLAAERADIYRTTLAADIMVSRASVSELRGVTAACLGPGGYRPTALSDLTRANFPGTLVLDAGAIAHHEKLSNAERALILTPHEGEFDRNFPGLAGPKTDRACRAAAASGAIIVLKGAQTIIAAPDGACAENHHASAYLAKAGTGDVLAGLITGLVAQGMSAFQACCAATWIHGDAAQRIGPGLIASDLAQHVPAVLRHLGIR